LIEVGLSFLDGPLQPFQGGWRFEPYSGVDNRPKDISRIPIQQRGAARHRDKRDHRNQATAVWVLTLCCINARLYFPYVSSIGLTSSLRYSGESVRFEQS
jgi:hypothetical protein